MNIMFLSEVKKEFTKPIANAPLTHQDLPLVTIPRATTWYRVREGEEEKG